MRKHLHRPLCLLLVLCMVLSMVPAALAADEVEINGDNFPDPAFQSWVKRLWDQDYNGSLSREERNAVTFANIQAPRVEDFSGLRFFPNLQEFICHGCTSLKRLPVEEMPGLTEFQSYGNPLTQLDLSKNTALLKVYFGDDSLTSVKLPKNNLIKEVSILTPQDDFRINLRDCSNLEKISTNFSSIHTLDLHDMKKLTSVSAYYSELEGLNVSGCTALEEINAYNSHLSSLDISSCTKLQQEKVNVKDCLYSIQTRSAVDCSTFPGKFDVMKVSNVKGGSFDAKNHAFQLNAKSNEASYDYDLGRGVKETFKIRIENPYEDVKTSDWYYDPILWARDNGITAGTAYNKFSPNRYCTRAEIVTFLWRSFGHPDPRNMDSDFTDLPKEDYYRKAILWAVERGITQGVNPENTLFAPNRVCTREEAMTFMWRLYRGGEYPGDESPFTDVTPDRYSYNPILWAVKYGLTVGTSATTFSPERKCTRAEIVTFLYRYSKLR